MRRIVLTALALVPAAALAQTSMQARIATPVIFASSANPAAATAATPSAVSLPVHFQDVVKTSLVSAALDEAFAQGGTLSYTISGGGNSKPEFTAPQLVHVVGRTLPVEQIANTDAAVTVSLTVDTQGVPQDIKVVRSAGQTIDKGTLDAIRQYRFSPAKYSNEPIVAHLNLQVALQK